MINARRHTLFGAGHGISRPGQADSERAAPPPSKAKQTGCAVQELYVIGLTTHDPAERHKAMLGWLDRTKCSADDYVTIWNALPEWAGTSDSPALRAKIMEKAR